MSTAIESSILVVTAAERMPELSALYDALALHRSIDVQRLDSLSQRSLSTALSHVDVSRYQRVLVHLPFPVLRPQTRFLSRVPGLVLYQDDAWQHHAARFYRALPNARVVVTGAGLAQRLRAQGVAARFLPRGVDAKRLFVEGLPRDIGLASIGSQVCGNALLERLAEVEPLQVLRAGSGDAYRQVLNRVQGVVSADVGVGEYLGTTLDAMACGCAVLAWRQGVEEAAIGLEEGEHVLLYSSLGELRGHLARLRREPWLRQALAQNGRAFVEQQLGYKQVAVGLVRVLGEPVLDRVREPAWQGWWEKMRRLALMAEGHRG